MQWQDLSATLVAAFHAHENVHSILQMAVMVYLQSTQPQLYWSCHDVHCTDNTMLHSEPCHANMAAPWLGNIGTGQHCHQSMLSVRTTLTLSMHCVCFSFLTDSANVSKRDTVSVESPSGTLQHTVTGRMHAWAVWVALGQMHSLEQGVYVAHDAHSARGQA